MELSLSLRTKLVCLFTAMTVIVLIGCFGMLWNTHRTESMLDSLVRKEFILYKVAQEMELALANQKGFLTYFLVDGDVKWLKSLGRYRQVFEQNLEQAIDLDLDDLQRQTINRINREYTAYREAKDDVIDHYNSGSFPGNISSLHEKQRDVFFGLLDLCRSFNQEQWHRILEAEQKTIHFSERLRFLVYLAIVVFFALCGLLLYILYSQILGPIRELAIETGSSPKDSSKDEVVSLSHSLKGMMKDFDETHDELAKSRKHLLQTERMAMVGELAAGVAHTIRNPFTSIKMRMFSLSRSINLTETQNEDLQVISEEIERIDKIVYNFLEFARPPKIRFEVRSLGQLIRSVVTLMDYRLKKHNTELIYEAQPDSPSVSVDPDRIKEAILNLITNGCEAMEAGGTITIKDTREQDPELGEVAVITIKDTGPGIPENIIHKVTTPFFTTKEEGSGLGLSIVARIVSEHGGKLQIMPSSHGAVIIIKLPTHRDNDEPGTDH